MNFLTGCANIIDRLVPVVFDHHIHVRITPAAHVSDDINRKLTVYDLIIFSAPGVFGGSGWFVGFYWIGNRIAEFQIIRGSRECLLICNDLVCILTQVCKQFFCVENSGILTIFFFIFVLFCYPLRLFHGI
jgi:hypothetical protein